jgi:hypothetical protein
MVTDRPFELRGRVSTDGPERVRPILGQVFPGAVVREEGSDFVVEGRMTGASAKDLNRTALSALRRAEKRTRFRAEWTAEDGTVYRFFDYVLLH